MSPSHVSYGSRWVLASLMLVLLLMAAPAPSVAQDNYPKADLFVGYQFLNPGGTIPLGGYDQFGNPLKDKLQSIPQGVGATLGYNFNKWLALEGDYGGNWNKEGNESTASGGPRLTWRSQDINLFVHTLAGYNRFAREHIDPSNGFGAILGGGMDLKLKPRWNWRVFEADYQLARHNFASIAPANDSSLQRPVFNGVRLRTGLVYNMGITPPVPPKAACSVTPTEVYAGEPVSANVNATDFNPKHTLKYDWSSSGGKITGNGTTASVDTTGLAPGSYAVTSHVSDPKVKKNGEASCTAASFTVKPKNPPTLSCSADPSTVQAGSSSTITCTCSSPDGNYAMPLTVANWSATGGNVSGSGSNATLTTPAGQPGAPDGTATVSATCTDARGLTANGSTNVTIKNPPAPPPAPQASKLNSCDFTKMDKVKKPWRVDNECKAILDDAAKNLQQNPDSKLVIVGNADPTEKFKDLAAQRAVNAKEYLTGGEAKQGIDASRIETRTGSAGGKTIDLWSVPAGATFPAAGTAPVDENAVKPYPPAKKAPAKKAAKKAM
jgi:outer membrane protein OmpA-like peptidoglycan-associated protein